MSNNQSESLPEPPRFQLCDYPRTFATTEYRRTIADYFGYLEPYEDESDSWRSMPLRLTHNTASGWGLECGPFNFDGRDINRLREAIAAYDRATGA
ncbi:Uncharacterised protein [Mycobacteroides abscessus subsp. abscessus]|uniref:hypothetical protein n=1 Tax=Mycobacteroides abscessus TaxID=36809 RepID=UPI00092BAC00|nr:hypothetical protein [Mycobacteroides abscessus]SHS37525.1 Uncharacterised protein [Mycobacteroides abscessus subsp. abscessus]SHS53105.1 Uncharacterised protein [Mycobacteroides abscessus subsp. abscessus]SHS85392.1 Uncharacterised protein [Mycobacteroides abscessus subsp. abscessus]SHT36786.1 Uncharacterised protein [Mycobacteroides abscessus subsp. abscessus]SHT83308.1 Uncharacterised protein [Mycobacteroides abscessus subsp. abscessus]